MTLLPAGTTTLNNLTKADEWFSVAQPILNAIAQGDPVPILLDVATGTGRVPLTLLKSSQFEGYIIGVDASEKMLAIAQKSLVGYEERYELRQSDAATLPFPAGSFDGVTCLEALEFFPDDHTALVEMARVLKSNAPLIVTRRTWVDGKCFLHKYRNEIQFETLLAEIGFQQISRSAWQVDYDLYVAFKKAE